MEEQISHIENFVCLQRWWLVKVEGDFDGKKLAVGGLRNGEKEARRLFTSAPIVKRYDDFNLETADGINVNLQCLIDEARTEANGFSYEMFKYFIFGFPPYWVECAKKFLSKESTAELPARYNTVIEASSPQAGEHESADKDSVQGSLDSSKSDKDQCLSVETVPSNPNSASIVQKQDTKQGQATSNPLLQKRKKNSSNALRNSNLGVETVRRNLSSASNVEKQDAKQGERKAKRNRHKITKKSAPASWNSRSVKNDLTSAVKRKRGVTADENLSSRDPEKKLADVNEAFQCTRINDRAHIVSPEAASFKRSRSGRLLLPSLEHWRNQRVVYNTDGKIVGVLGLES